jgi:hypothetical protein
MPPYLLHRMSNWHFTQTRHHDTDPVPELVAQLANETYNSELLLALVTNIGRFDFEARKDVAQIFNVLLRFVRIGSRVKCQPQFVQTSDRGAVADS